MTSKVRRGVTARQMNDHLEALYTTSDPTVGLFGPDTMVWRVGREAAVILGGGRAALLQLSHPYIAHAISQHSTLLDDIRGRFQRTLSMMFAMTFGDRAEAIRLARRIYHQHRVVKGQLTVAEGSYPSGHRYSALNPSAMFWVAATLWDTSISVYETLVEPLSLAEKEQYYSETKRFCRLFGLSDSDMPSSWSRFREYVDEMCTSSQLHVGAEANRLARQIFAPPNPVMAPLYHWIKLMTAASLPAKLRQAYGLSFDTFDHLKYKVGLMGIKRGLRRLPDSLRYCPEYLNARRRVAGEPGIDLASDLFKRAFLKMMGPML